MIETTMYALLTDNDRNHTVVVVTKIFLVCYCVTYSGISDSHINTKQELDDQVVKRSMIVFCSVFTVGSNQIFQY